MKILQIIRGLDIGGDSGGAEVFGIKLARELNKLPDCQVWICAFFSVGTETENAWLEQLNNEGIKTFFVSEWGGYNNLKKFVKGIRNLTANISKINIDVCHSHFHLGTLAAVFLKLFKYTKTAYRTAHIRKEWVKGRWTWILSPVFMKHIFPKYLNGEIGVSKAVCDYLIQRNPGRIDPRKIHLIYNGIDVNNFLEKSQQPLEAIEKNVLCQSNHNIGCVGRLTDQKGYPYIIEAMSELRKIIPDITLNIAGDGIMKPDLENLVANYNLEDKVRFLGLRNDVPALMRHWDLFVLPSLWEGFPTVIMEAMLINLPVIATNIPGTNELVLDQQTGLLVPPKDPKALTESIVKMFSQDSLRKRLVENARKYVYQFSMKNIAREYHDLYTQHLMNEIVK